MSIARCSPPYVERILKKKKMFFPCLKNMHFSGVPFLKCNWGITELRLFPNNGIILKQMEPYRNRNNLLYLQNTNLQMYHQNMLFLHFSLPTLRSPQMEITHSLDPVLNSDSHSMTTESSCIYQQFPCILNNWTVHISGSLTFADILFVKFHSEDLILISTIYS